MTISLKNVQYATKQEIFDQVAVHLLQQGRRSMKDITESSVGSCAYRGDGGLKCAAGCLIADDEYVPEMDQRGYGVGAFEGQEYGTSWRSLVRRGFVTNANNSDFIDSLQAVHDNNRFSEEELRVFAANNNLNTVAIDRYVSDK